MHFDALFFGGVIHTGANESETFSVMGVKKGKVAYLGDVLPAGSSATRAESLGGRHVFPALIDAHLHLMFTVALSGRSFSACELRDGCVFPADISGIEGRIRAGCAGYGRGDTVVVSNYIISAIAEKRLPVRAELDEWCGGRPVVVYSIDGHSSALSSAMLKKIGIDDSSHSGVLTGPAHEDMQGRITDAIADAVGPRQLSKGVAEFQNTCAGYGITAVCALEGNADTVDDKLTSLCVALARRMDISVRLYPQYRDVERAKALGDCMRRLRIGGCGEWEMDGAVGSHSAAFYEPYADTGVVHDCYYTPEQVRELTVAAEQSGCQISSHAIGSKAIDCILDALIALKSTTMHRIEHFEFPTREAVEKIKDANVAVCVQPGYSWVDKRYLKSYEQFLPAETIAAQLPLRELFDGGVCVCGGSDSPVQSTDPYIQLLGMTDFYLPGQSLTPYQAFCAYTKNAAAAMLEADERGTLEIGKAADFFVAGQNLFELSPAEIAQFKVKRTYIAGRRYKKKRGSLLELAAMFLRKPKKI